MTVTYAVENLATARDEMEALFPLHWAEVARDRDTIILDPDWDSYYAFEAVGQFHCMVCRVDGNLAGYHICFVRPHLHYKNSLSAITDIFFIHPDHRQGRIGVQLFKESEKSLRERGVQKIYLGCKISKDLTPLFERLGYAKIEYVFAKVIND